MAARAIYAGLAVIGAIVPLVHLRRFLVANGPAPEPFLGQLFGTPVSAFFGWDVIISGIVLLIFIQLEGPRRRVPHLWAPILGTLFIGVSFGLPLFLALREGRPVAESGSADA
jgi:Protein of unknown function DUF2834